MTGAGFSVNVTDLTVKNFLEIFELSMTQVSDLVRECHTPSGFPGPSGVVSGYPHSWNACCNNSE